MTKSLRSTRFLFLLLASVLLGAAAAKGYSFSRHAEERTFWIMLEAVGEAGLAVWLLAGWRLKATRVITFIAFVIFLALSLFRGLHEGSCGCFGRLEVPWGLVAAFDAAAVLALAIPGRARLHGWATGAVALFATLLLCTGAWKGWQDFSATRADGKSALPATRQLVVLEPATWEGKPLPIMPFISPNSDLQKGEWLVFLYQMQCRHCQMAIPFFLDAADKLKSRGSPRRVAFVEMPPHSATDDEIDPKSPVVRMDLSDAQEWSVRTPVVLMLKDGIVTKVPETPDDVPEEWGGYPPMP